VTNERLQFVLDIHRADITKMLSEMCANKLLESSGHGRGTRYHVYGTNVALPEANITLNMDTSEANVALSDPNVALPSANMALNMDTSESNVTLPSANVTLECYTSESNVTLPKRYTKVQLKEKVLSICSDWVTAEQIAAQLGRDVRYIKSHVLPQMADILEKMYDVPHHPRQKYRVKIE